MISISSLTALASLAVAAAPAAPSFQTSYSRAVALASEQHKPVAVFISTGEAGYQKLVTEGTLPAEVTKTLQSDYVCLYVDTTTTTGKELASEFKMTEGLVISDRTAGVQALRHDGTVSGNDLTNIVKTYANPAVVVTTTVQQGRIVNTTPTIMTTTSTSAYTPAPVYSPAPVYAPAPAPYYPSTIMNSGYAPMYRPTSSCPNGRCPNAR